MPQAHPAHPDRAAATLANVADVVRERAGHPPAPPGAGARDCRIDHKLLAFRALAAADCSPRARDRLAVFDPARHPDLWAGTVQDGTARGFAAALEEAIALGPAAPAPLPEPEPATVVTGKQLRTKKDLLVKSGGARVRFSRREGLLYVDRGDAVHSANCLWFEALKDHGTLDAFAPPAAERARLFSVQFLKPQRYATAPGYARLDLAGRLGRRHDGFDAEVAIVGRETEDRLELRIAIDNRQRDVRLRARFLGVPSAHLAHACTDVLEVVQRPSGGFVAFTLLRACGRLAVDDAIVAVPAAQCLGRIEHELRLGPG